MKGTRAGLAGMLAIIGVAAATAVAQAQVSGGCDVLATSAQTGSSAALSTTNTWHIVDGDTLTIQTTMPSVQHHLSVSLYVYGLPITLQTANGAALHGSTTVYVSNYSWMARVFAMSGKSDSCSGAGTVIIDDRPVLATFIGMLGFIVFFAGLLGLAALVIGRGSFIACAATGCVAGLGAGLLMQQMAMMDPANLSDFVIPAIGLVVGLVCAALRQTVRSERAEARRPYVA